MDINLLVKLSSKAWSLNILALLDSGVPGRQASLLAATSAGRTAFVSSLEHLIELGLVERNPGHGHPFRPEFRLTTDGAIVAKIASRIVKLVPNDTDFALLRRNWSVPVLALTSAPRRFSEIKSGLGTITDRALSKSLYQLEDKMWLKREINLTSRVPYPTYHAQNLGIDVNRAIGLTF